MNIVLFLLSTEKKKKKNTIGLVVAQSGLAIEKIFYIMITYNISFTSR